MIGDGANDCAALKASDIGISISGAECSIAAQFKCSKPDVSCVIEVKLNIFLIHIFKCK
jgi:cation-transporting ATPase 13A3/4/5